MPIVKPVTFATAAENIAGTAENKAIDPLGIREALNCTGNAPVYACRAWVNFNGTGTVAIRASGNVSSITDNGTGDYTVNFTTAMPDANYCCQFSMDYTGLDSTLWGLCWGKPGSSPTSQLKMYSAFGGNVANRTPSDWDNAFAAVFR